MELNTSDKNKIKALKSRLKMFGVGHPVISLMPFNKATNINDAIEKGAFRFAFILQYNPFSSEFDTTSMTNSSKMHEVCEKIVEYHHISSLPLFSKLTSLFTCNSPYRILSVPSILSEFSISSVLKIAYMDYRNESLDEFIHNRYENWLLKLWNKEPWSIDWIPAMYNLSEEGILNIDVTKLTVSQLGIDDEYKNAYRLLESDEDYLWLANFIISQCKIQPWSKDAKHDNVMFYFTQFGLDGMYVNYKSAKLSSYAVFGSEMGCHRIFWSSNDIAEEILIKEDLNQDLN